MQLLYFHDALCGWCYGFSPVMNEFAADHPGIDVRVVAGGMITGERIGPIGEVAGYIKSAYKVVEDRCNVKFGQGFLRGVLEPGTTVFTSIPAAVALAAVRQLKPAAQLSFSSAVQRAVYYDGIDPSDEAAYAMLAAERGIDTAAFVRTFRAAETRAAAAEDFVLSRRYGVTGFPTVVLQNDKGAVAIARGYVDGETLERNFVAGQRQLT